MDWLKLHRKILDSVVFADERALRVWIWCLCRANHKERWWHGTRIKVGSFVTSRISGASDLDLTIAQWRGVMAKLVEWGMITMETTSQFTIVSVCHWGTYQFTDAEKSPAASQRLANEQPAASQRLAIDKEGKNSEGKNSLSIPQEDLEIISFQETEDVMPPLPVDRFALGMTPVARLADFVAAYPREGQRKPAAIRNAYAVAVGLVASRDGGTIEGAELHIVTRARLYAAIRATLTQPPFLPAAEAWLAGESYDASDEAYGADYSRESGNGSTQDYFARRVAQSEEDNRGGKT